jgi:hypothetical protein
MTKEVRFESAAAVNPTPILMRENPQVRLRLTLHLS